MERCKDCLQLVADVGCERCTECHFIMLAESSGVTFTQEASATRAAKKFERCGFVTTIAPVEWNRGGGYRVTIQRKAAAVQV